MEYSQQTNSREQEEVPQVSRPLVLTCHVQMQADQKWKLRQIWSNLDGKGNGQLRQDDFIRLAQTPAMLQALIFATFTTAESKS